jgi:hypothetical protein
MNDLVVPQSCPSQIQESDDVPHGMRDVVTIEAYPRSVIFLDTKDAQIVGSCTAGLTRTCATRVSCRSVTASSCCPVPRWIFRASGWAVQESDDVPHGMRDVVTIEAYPRSVIFLDTTRTCATRVSCRSVTASSCCPVPRWIFRVRPTICASFVS